MRLSQLTAMAHSLRNYAFSRGAGADCAGELQAAHAALDGAIVKVCAERDDALRYVTQLEDSVVYMAVTKGYGPRIERLVERILSKRNGGK